ncbi:hypothetical protein RIF29_14446 [Crotalaria pallida]|uniref:Uncharacterized protein n=1 Tax=Crotalaria pallida TaxID=3830 RepID=A0AAN9IBM3_CROPI
MSMTTEDWLKPNVVLEAFEARAARMLVACAQNLSKFNNGEDEKALGKLETILDGFGSVEVVPSLFAFMGNFSSHPCNLSFHSYSSLRLNVEMPAIIAKFISIASDSGLGMAMFSLG